MLSNTSKYALKAVLLLVKESSEEHKILAKNIAEACDIPRPFLSNILRQLAQNKYISSAKGRNGGFYLTENQLNRSILDIIITVEGKDQFNQCALNLDYCSAENPCAIHDLIAAEKEALRKQYKSVKLSQLRN